jgi:hypothetical protein
VEFLSAMLYPSVLAQSEIPPLMSKNYYLFTILHGRRNELVKSENVLIDCDCGMNSAAFAVDGQKRLQICDRWGKNFQIYGSHRKSTGWFAWWPLCDEKQLLIVGVRNL